MSNVIDLCSSDEEDESPNEAARSALDRFINPRDEKGRGRPTVNGLNGHEHRDDGIDGEGHGSQGLARTQALSGFLPRKDKPGTNESISATPQQRVADGIGSTHDNWPGLRADALAGLPAPNRRRGLDPPVGMRSSLDSYALSRSEERVESGDSKSPRRENQAIRSFAPEAASLAGFLQAQQSNHLQPVQAPKFKYPTSNNMAMRPHATPQRESPLQIVDLFERNGSERSIDQKGDEDTRPLKRQRLSFPGLVDPKSPQDSTASAQDYALAVPPKQKPTMPQHKNLLATHHGEAIRSDRKPSDSPRAVRSSDLSGKMSTPWHTRHHTKLKPQAHAESPTAFNPSSTTSKPNPSLAAPELFEQKPSGPKPQFSEAEAPRYEQKLPHGPKVVRGVSDKSAPASRQPQGSGRPISSFGNVYTPEEDALLAELKEDRKLSWNEMLPYFSGRTKGSLQVRYSTKVNKRHQQRDRTAVSKLQGRQTQLRDDLGSGSTPAPDAQPRRRRKRSNDAAAASGMISWAEVGRRTHLEDEGAETDELSGSAKSAAHSQFLHERAHPRSLSRILRQRELGDGRRDGSRTISNELKEHIFDDVGPLKYHKGTSGDVACLAWSSDGRHFAAGSIAITDERSMQYNLPGNLIVGDYSQGTLHELPEHHLPRPAITAKGNVNGLHAMRESQDPRLFMTVANVEFSPDGRTLYSAGTDSRVRAYDMTRNYTVSHAIKHSAPLDLLSVSNTNVLATACHQSENGSIGIYRGQEHLLALSPSHHDRQTSRAIYPSTLKWGRSHHHSNLLLAGFSIDSIDEERDIAGETCLWDVAAERRIQLPVTRNVFDVAWNPRPTSASTVFAVANTPGTQKVTKGTRTVVQCFAPNQGRASRVLEWESPAFDINDVIYCQHDDNLIAAGATDGKVYVWDQRFAGRRPTPLHVLEHGESLNIVDTDRPREIMDTGVRFLSWGATSTRLYTGSSDGVVKMWNPYMPTENAHIKDIATFATAIMSGAFSPDYRDLLIGEDGGRINSLSIGHGSKAVRSMRKFEFVPAPAPETHDNRFAKAHELLHFQQVVFRPMGDLPIRQAVQGPKYAGPYLMPTAEEMQQAEDAYNAALQAQGEAHARLGTLGVDDETAQAARNADKLAEEAGGAVAAQQSRLIHATNSYPKAKANQARLHEAERARFKLEASLSRALECCKLDCNYVPAEDDDGLKVVDSERSEGRIPGNLRALPPRDPSLLTPDEAIEAGLTSKCILCSAPAPKAKVGLPFCEPCATFRCGLTAKCARCSAAARPGTNASGTYCEKCSFACFRCGCEGVVLSEGARYVACKVCDLTWEVGVLGYELISDSKKRSLARRADRRSSAGEGRELGEDEMERYAALWGST